MAVRIASLFVLIALPLTVLPSASYAGSMHHHQATRYLGAPILPLTAAVVTAGGGAKRFDSLRLFAVLTGPHEGAELAALTRRYGKARVRAFTVTFDHAIDDALTVATNAGVTLPPAPSYLRDGGTLSAHLIAAGTMANGRYDVGFMLEHLISRKIHVVIMQQLNTDPAVGSVRNADFHAILASLMGDLKTQYGV